MCILQEMACDRVKKSRAECGFRQHRIGIVTVERSKVNDFQVKAAAYL